MNIVPPSNGYNTEFLRADGTWNIMGVIFILINNINNADLNVL